ncbi:unannotated protein [freshwater metagenome]|uniref:Unannotated protein n=1 Tax=freshwater metagenome TaxID=449393 RepID=A0A6J7GD49_9ZZZZ
MTATRLPRSANAIERLVVTEDLPTPPFPEAIAIMRVRESRKGFIRGRGGGGPELASTTANGLAGGSPFNIRARAIRSSSFMSRASTSTTSTPWLVRTASLIRVASSPHWPRSSKGWATATTTAEASIATPRTIPSSVIGYNKIGSSTVPSTARTAAS